MRNLFYLILLLCNHSIFAQKEIGISTGYATNGYGIMVDYSQPVKESRFSSIGLGSFFSTEKKGDIEIPYQTYSGSYSHYLKLHQAETNNLSLGVGAVGSYQHIGDIKGNLDEDSEIEAESKFIFGVVISAMYDYRISKYFKTFATFMQNYHFNSDIGGFSLYAGVGVRYVIF